MPSHDKVFEKKATEKSFREEREKRVLSSVTAAAEEFGEISSHEDPVNNEGTSASEGSEYT